MTFWTTVGLARDEIRIVGSSAVWPYAQTVAENFAYHSNQPAPSLEMTGTGNGFRLFCAGVGFEYPDINATPRPISDAELKQCQTNGVTTITEIKIGFDAIVVVNANTSPRYNFTTPQLFSALASEIEKNGRIIENPFTNWNEIHPALPDTSISVMGPPNASTSYDALLELIMQTGCKAFPAIVAKDPVTRYQMCRTLRKDGAFVVSGKRNETEMLAWLKENPKGFGISRFSFLQENADRIAGNAINGAIPSLANMSNGRYPLI